MTSVRTVILSNNGEEILLMHRVRSGEEFYLIPGGTVDAGETPEETAIREIAEETNLDIILDKRLGDIKDMWEGKEKTTIFYLAKSWSGKPKIVGEELKQIKSDNIYELKWIKLEQTGNIPMFPQKTYEVILKPLLK